MFLNSENIAVSDNGRYLILFVTVSKVQNILYFADLEKNGPINGKIPLMQIATKTGAVYNVNKINHSFYLTITL